MAKSSIHDKASSVLWSEHLPNAGGKVQDCTGQRAGRQVQPLPLHAPPCSSSQLVFNAVMGTCNLHHPTH
jgi:hypothetical protein